MARSLEARLAHLTSRLEQAELQHVLHVIEQAARQVGVTREALLDEARRIFALPDDEQRAVLGDTYAELNDDQARELDAIRHRHATILRRHP
jgi:hypothetical protein